MPTTSAAGSTTTTSFFASRGRIVVALFTALLLLGACGGDDDTTAPARGDDSETPASTETGDDSEVDSEPSGSEASDVPGLRMAAIELKAKLLAEEVEVDGNTIHVYAKERDVNVTGECLIATQAVPEGAKVVIHHGGTETTC